MYHICVVPWTLWEERVFSNILPSRNEDVKGDAPHQHNPRLLFLAEWQGREQLRMFDELWVNWHVVFTY